MLTLMHEDIYVYVDSIIEVVETQTAANSFTFANDATEQIADLGIFNITVASGNYTKVVITVGNKAATFNTALAAGSVLTLNFRDLNFSKGSILIFADDIPMLADDENNNITIALTGTGSATITRKYNKAQLNNNDVWFVESLTVDTSIEFIKKILLSGKEKILNSEKKVHSFSINGLWSQEEVSKFTNLFRIRLVDEENTKLETLVNCRISSNGKSSSSGGDLTYAISGSCEKIL